MATIIKHRKVRIVVLTPDEDLRGCCKAGDIAIEGAADAWWTRFVGPDGQVDSYDQPYASYNEALWAAKAAAEFGLD